MDNSSPEPLFEQSTPGHIDVPVTHGPPSETIVEAKFPKRTIRWGVLTFFFVQGIGFASWASRIPDIKKTLDLSDAGLGSVLFALPAGSIIGLPFAGFLVTRFGSKHVVTIAATLYALVLIAIGFATSTWQLVAGLLIFGTSGNLVNIAINTQAIGVEELYKKSIMASFHGAWSLAGFAGAAFGGAMVSAGIAPGYHFAGIAVFGVIAVIVAQRFLLTTRTAGDDHPLFVFPDGPLLRLGVIGFCGMACEGAMFDWSGVYFQTVVLAPAALVTLGYIVFMCAMAAGRFTADWLVNHIGRKRMIQLSGVLITLGLSTSITFPYLVPATIGFLLVGFGVSSIVPLISAGLIVLSVLTRPYWGLAKLGATPAWLFLCSAFTILAFLTIYWVADVFGKANWFSIIKPAGTDTLLCYLIPYFAYATTRFLDVHLPEFALIGAVGLLKSFMFALLCAYITGWLSKFGIRLKL